MSVEQHKQAACPDGEQDRRRRLERPPIEGMRGQQQVDQNDPIGAENCPAVGADQLGEEEQADPADCRDAPEGEGGPHSCRRGDRFAPPEPQPGRKGMADQRRQCHGHQPPVVEPTSQIGTADRERGLENIEQQHECCAPAPPCTQHIGGARVGVAVVGDLFPKCPPSDPDRKGERSGQKTGSDPEPQGVHRRWRRSPSKAKSPASPMPTNPNSAGPGICQKIASPTLCRNQTAP